MSAERLRIVILSEAYAEAMGYAGTCIPQTMAKHPELDVHYVTAGLPVYYSMQNFQETYGDFQKRLYKPGDVRDVDGYKVHYLDFYKTYGGVRLRALREKLEEINPHVVQVFGHITWGAVDAALLQRAVGYKLFTGNHTTASVYPLAGRNAPPWDPQRIVEFIKRGIPGRFVTTRSEMCYGATSDCSDVALRFFGASAKKLKTVPLGVDTDIFHPAKDDREREAAVELRRSLGVSDQEILCVYTGRFAADKNPLLLAQAVEGLRAAGEPYRAVFFGEGVQRDAIAACEGTVVRPFVHYSKLGDLYRAADMGVWPTQESTSMIDCAASGTPIVVNDTLAAVERVEGNGLQYRLNDVEDLKAKLLILKDPAKRQELGDFGARKMEDRFSWNALVQVRLDDYRAALGWPAQGSDCDVALERAA